MQARFGCVECGFEENADMVGTINILAAGHAVLACGEPVQLGRHAKQEPAEATRTGHASPGAVEIPDLQAGEDVKSIRTLNFFLSCSLLTIWICRGIPPQHILPQWGKM